MFGEAVSWKPVVSTITPCFRMGKYLQTFLEKLPNQSIFEDLEVFLDLNEPTQKELSTALKFQSLYGPHLHVNVVNKVDPIGVSMNRCIDKSKGELLAIWNVDDLRTDSSLEDQVATFNDNVRSAFVYGPYRVVSGFGQIQGKLVDNRNLDNKSFNKGMAAGPFFLFPRSHLTKVGLFDEQFYSGADFDLIQRLLTIGGPVSTKSLLGYYLDEGLGASTRPNSRQPIERTVIEVRYGHIDSIDPLFLDAVADYDPSKILVAGKWLPMSEVISGYRELREINSMAFKKKLLSRQVFKRVIQKLIRLKLSLKR
jgi:glycosyltransferase involved in cell wall biosynthesis